MDKSQFEKKLREIYEKHNQLLSKPNAVDADWHNGLYERFVNPVLTAEHAPLHWRYDLNHDTNPHLIERIGVNAALNSGAMMLNGKVILVVRTEGTDRKSFFAVAESPNGIDNFKFWERPITMPETDDPDTNVYDMRLTQHEDGWIYGVFCSERKDPEVPASDTSTAVAAAGIARTKDLVTWERLPDLVTKSPQQRNVVLHPEFIDGKYGFYTRPQDGFIDTGAGGGIGWGLADDITNAKVMDEQIVDAKVYHTIMEVKNGLGPTPFKTEKGWLHIAHGVRNTAAGLRYVLYGLLCDLNEPWKVLHRPGGHLIAPRGPERIGDVSNVVFSNGAVLKDDGELLIYYGSSDTRMHVARTTLEKMLDYCINTPEDPYRSYACVQQRNALIDRNLPVMKELGLSEG